MSSGIFLNRGELPDREVVDQILVVINNLLALAVEQAIRVASDEEMEAICAATRVLSTAVRTARARPCPHQPTANRYAGEQKSATAAHCAISV